MDRAAIVDALDNEIARRDYDPDDDGIIAVVDLPPAARAPTKALYIDNNDDVRDASEDEDKDDDDNNANDNDGNDDDDDDSDDDNNDDNKMDNREANDAAAVAAGLRRSGRAHKGRTKRFANYTLLLHARKAARGGPR